ncbi:MAG: glycosyltransferase family 4 protein [Candidatus Sumerlaeaceae bacterium]|nr:glycosyltransferase family 4 protein [Candidatus Sumerlaeaceae bacterium]
MRIAIDARYMRGEFSGIGVYSENLIEALGKEDRENEYVVFVHSSYRGDPNLAENFELVKDPARPVSLRTIGTFQRAIKSYNVDVLHSLFPLVPMFWQGKTVATVYDLQALLDPEFTGGRRAWKRAAYDAFYRFAYPATFRKADYIISSSLATKHQIAAYFPDVADKILVVHGGVDAESFGTPLPIEIDRVQERYDLPARFLFYIGSTRPNKNLMMMLDAFEEFLRLHPEQDDLHWVLVLNPDRFFDAFFAKVREKNLLRRVQIHQQVSESEKRVFYHKAEMLYFVTKFEGFGLPVLEAQAQGLPVMASTHAALPEVAGSAALLCDPDERDSIVGGLEKFYTDPSLREKMIEAGRINVKRFTWSKVAKEVINLYNHLLA